MAFRTVLLAGAFVALLSQSAFCQTIASKVDYLGQSRHLSVTGLMARHINGLLALQIEISNSDYDDQQGYYRIHWIDAQGFDAWEDEAWKPVLLHGTQKQAIQITAPTLKAVDFRIEFSGDSNWANNMGPAPVPTPGRQ